MKKMKDLILLLFFIFDCSFCIYHFSLEDYGQKKPIPYPSLKKFSKIESSGGTGIASRPPDKVLQGCSQELLHLQGFRQFTLMCRMQPPLAVVAYEGILDAMGYCREQMRFQPWDCSQPGTILHEPTILRYGYKESAYLLAMSSAGAAWGVATACAQGWLEECRCVHPKVPGGPSRSTFDSSPGSTTEDWEWGGCSYGVQFGIAASRKILTRSGSGRSPLRILEKHNLKSGRLAVKKTLISSCKCHGVSGSCQQKTCWKKTSDLKAITIYLESTPDHCAPQLEYQMQQRRSLPRICNWRNETHSEGDCGSLCCGRGYKVSHEVISYKCDCKFVWCCKLECNDCLQHRWVSTCNT
ncbi:hypothetical protein FO519_008228 [Halicephalobus sp. NKZ332]|nr:hypothetical protein FO519_008228 [Halicephalobus sp. NKZ332]